VVVGATVVLVVDVDVDVVGAGVVAVVVGSAAFEPPLQAAATSAATPARVTSGVLRNVTF
jgi:hypothetical protein